jgi:hypothetical protein
VGDFEQALRALPHLPEQRDARAQAIDLWRALALATADGDVVLQALTNQRRGYSYQAQGDSRRAIECCGQMVAPLDRARRHERFGQVFLPSVNARAWLAACQAELGLFVAGRAFGEEGLRSAEGVNHPANRMVASGGIGLLSLRQGDLPWALSRLEGAVIICQAADFLVWVPRLAALLGAAYTLGGRVAEAVPLLTRAMELPIASARVDSQACCRLALGGGNAGTGGGAVMDFDAVLAQVHALLQRHGRVSYRALRLRCQLDDETLAALARRGRGARTSPR